MFSRTCTDRTVVPVFLSALFMLMLFESQSLVAVMSYKNVGLLNVKLPPADGGNAEGGTERERGGGGE